MAIVPNPVENGPISVYYNSFNNNDYLVRVYNTLGETLFEQYFSFTAGINGFKISSDNLSNGAYLIVLESENTYSRKKFMILRP